MEIRKEKEKGFFLYSSSSLAFGPKTISLSLILGRRPAQPHSLPRGPARHLAQQTTGPLPPFLLGPLTSPRAPASNQPSKASRATPLSLFDSLPLWARMSEPSSLPSAWPSRTLSTHRSPPPRCVTRFGVSPKPPTPLKYQALDPPPPRLALEASRNHPVP